MAANKRPDNTQPFLFCAVCSAPGDGPVTSLGTQTTMTTVIQGEKHNNDDDNYYLLFYLYLEECAVFCFFFYSFLYLFKFVN